MDSTSQAVADFIFTPEVEGGFNKRSLAADPGGATKHGISIRFAGQIKLDLDGDGDTDEADIIAVNKQIASDLLHTHFYLKSGADKLPPALAFAVTDVAFMSGPRRAIVTLQQAIGVESDGVLGPKTLAAIKKWDAKKLLGRYLSFRIKYLQALDNYGHNANGWLTRTMALYYEARCFHEKTVQ